MNEIVVSAVSCAVGSAVISAAYTMHYAAIKTVWSWFKSFAGLCLMSAAAIALLNVGG